MKCRQVASLLLKGGNPEESAREHIAECNECRGLTDLCVDLDRAGSAMRTRDFAEEQVRETRLRAAEILHEAAGGELPDTVGAAAWRRLIGAKFPLVVGAALVLLFGAAVFSLCPRKGAEPSAKAPPVAQANVSVFMPGGEVDASFDQLAQGLDADLRSFRQRYEGDTEMGFERAIAGLRSRIETHRTVLLRDL